MTYIRIRAWHIIAGPTRGIPGRYELRCGRTAEGTIIDSLPLGERSCETCLRLARHDEEVK